MFEHWALVTKTRVRGLGSMTSRREKKKKGLEPDECYYIQRPRLIRRSFPKMDNGMPPPDLALEVDVSRSSVNRFRIYANLGVRERPGAG